METWDSQDLHHKPKTQNQNQDDKKKKNPKKSYHEPKNSKTNQTTKKLTPNAYQKAKENKTLQNLGN